MDARVQPLRSTLACQFERLMLLAGFFRASSTIGRERQNRVVFVCSGNICRSPYAEALATAAGINAVSCGTDTTGGRPADSTAIAEARRRGTDLQAHRTTRFQDLEIHSDDLIVCTEWVHARRVRSRARSVGSQLILLNSLLGPAFPGIWDPYGLSEEAYRLVFDRIDTAIERLAGLLTDQPVSGN